MGMNDILPKRKHPRLECYDYSSEGAYYVTICTQNRRCMLSRIVGQGLAPAACDTDTSECKVEYTEYGKIAEQQFFLLEQKYPYLTVDKYVIMPNHIHVIFIFGEKTVGDDEKTAGVNPRPTLMDIVCSYKSLTTRECKKTHTIDKLFQTSFYEHVIRDKEDYRNIVKYIHENPLMWQFDKLYENH